MTTPELSYWKEKGILRIHHTLFAHFMSTLAAFILLPLLVVIASSSDLSSPGEVLFFEDFDDATTAFSRFSPDAGITFRHGAMTVSPGVTAVLSGDTLIDDSGNSPVVYSVTQTFAPGSLIFPHQATAGFRIRGSSTSQRDGYYLATSLNSSGPYIGIDRITDAEWQEGILRAGVGGGSIYAPPALKTLGPYKLDITLFNSPDSVIISVAVNGTVALVARDYSMHRITGGDSFSLLCEGTQAATWDNLSVVTVPESSTFVLGLIGCLVFLLPAFRREHNAF